MKNEHENKTYLDRSQQMEREAVAATLEHARELLDIMGPKIKLLAEQMVDCGGDVREVGLLLDELYLPPEAEAAAAYYRAHYEPVLKINHWHFRAMIVAAKRMAKKPTCVADMYSSQTPLLLGFDLIALPEREEAQTRHTRTPYTEFFNRLNGSRVELDKWFKQLDDAAVWDAPTKESVVEVIDEHEKWLQEARAKLVRK